MVRRQYSQRAHSSIQSGPRERALRVVDLAAEVSEKAAWNERRYVLVRNAHRDDSGGSSESDRDLHFSNDLSLSADPSGFRFVLMDPAEGLAVFVLEVFPERFKLLDSNQRDLSPWVDERRAWLHVEPDELFCGIGKAPSDCAEPNVQSLANRWGPRVGS